MAVVKPNVVVGMTVLVLLACGVWWFGGSSNLSGWSPLQQMNQMVDGVGQPLFNPLAGISQTEARQKYRLGLYHLQQGQYQQAADAFEALKPAYPRLGDFIRLHLAEAYEPIPREDQVQANLTTLLAQYPRSPLRAAALYRLGQSYARSGQSEDARQAFTTLLDKHATTSWAVGARYYLGHLAPEGSAQQLDYWRQYVEQAPDGRFATELVSALQQRLPNSLWTAPLHAAAGEALVRSRTQSQQAEQHLKQGPLAKTWLFLATAQLLNKKPTDAMATLRQGLPLADSSEQVQEALELMRRNLTADQMQSVLKPLHQQAFPTGADAIAWTLAQLDAANAPAYYQRLLKAYPDSPYAPESQWALLRPLVLAGNWATFQPKGQAFLKRYAYAAAAPKVAFWLGKAAEQQGQYPEAQRHYQRVLSDYPYTYYAMRAFGRLQELKTGQPDGGWPVLAYEQSNYTEQVGTAEPETVAAAAAQVTPLPPTSATTGQADASLGFTPTLEAIPTGILATVAASPNSRPLVDELGAIGASTDLRLWLQERGQEPSAALEAWHAQQQGHTDQGIRLLRDSLLAKANEVKQLSPDALRVLYPLPYTDTIATFARDHRLDPYLVQSLMREESFFNRLAVSSSNAMGLMQLLPSTASEVAGWEGMGFQAVQLFVPEVNVQLGTRYMQYLFKQLNHPMFSVGAYNGGPGAMQRWLKEAPPEYKVDLDRFVEAIPYEQTRTYIQKVFGSYWVYNLLYQPERFGEGLQTLAGQRAALSPKG